ncbi:TonB-dependent siderophore receptor [Aquabacterium sp. OR-4]|uniref:TonB-dependent siderophore receptor n=1 Tax=Aquabacterium sp. OR-4 TaxID=2978127 RepID=UPI0028C77E0D|nr:TonB-dependent siderophore receptor [Aquabacterium sp. OR-4]MDT7836652.1 TonB-dependent siderophore receptor [Aquabacterium sp. OR-4]
MSSSIRSRAHTATRRCLPGGSLAAAAALSSLLPLSVLAQTQGNTAAAATNAATNANATTNAAPSNPVASPASSKPATPGGDSKATTLPDVGVKAQRELPNKADVSASPKFTQPLVDTPKTVQVIKQETLREQGAATLMEALRNTPGITLQLGENGNTAAGDTFQLRGFAAQSATFVDGLRDLGPVTRDVFNLDQVEVVKGPSGSDIGRGAAAGYINLISKLPELDNEGQASLTLGSAERKRATVDINRRLGGQSAARLNLMAQNSGVPGASMLRNKGWALAPALSFGLQTPTRVHLYSLHQRQDNQPDGGIPSIGRPGFYNADALLAAGAPVDRNNYYGSRHDREKVEADMFTARIEHDWAPGLTLRNLTRAGRSHMDRVLTGVNALSRNNSTDPALWTVARTRQRVDQTNTILANQTLVNAKLTLAGLQHDLVGGAELLNERQTTLGTGTTAQLIRGVSYGAIAIPAANLYRPNVDDVLGLPYLTGIDTEGQSSTVAAFVADTLTLNPQWKINAGLRVERYRTTTTGGTLVTSTNLATYASQGYAVGGVVPANMSNSGDLSSWNLGVVYKPAAHGSLYAAAGNSSTPPGSANFALSATSTNQANASMKPQRTRIVELGSKWDLLDKRLNLSGALYRTVNDNQVTQDLIDRSFIQDGRTTVRGAELAAVGQLTNFWQLTAALASMKTSQQSQRSIDATTGAVTNTTGLRWSPEFSATLWTSYTLGDFTLGGGVRHVGEQKRVITDSAAAANMPSLPGYDVIDLMAAWKVSRQLNLQLNVGNVADKNYVAALNNSGARFLLGAPRNVQLTAALQF